MVYQPAMTPPTGEPRGRPRVHDRQQLLELLEQYIANTPIPILAEFAYLNNLHSQQLYEFPELSDAIKKAISKKEAALEMGGLTGSLNPSMAIFSLKQLGWADSQKTVTEHEIKIVGGLPD